MFQSEAVSIMGGAIAINAFGQLEDIDGQIAASAYSSFEDVVVDTMRTIIFRALYARLKGRLSTCLYGLFLATR